jgi:hypothetical protein
MKSETLRYFSMKSGIIYELTEIRLHIFVTIFFMVLARFIFEMRSLTWTLY